MSDELRPTTTEEPEAIGHYVDTIEAAIRDGDPVTARLHAVRAKDFAPASGEKLARRTEEVAISFEDMARSQDIIAGLTAGAVPILLAMLKSPPALKPGETDDARQNAIYVGMVLALAVATYAFARAKLQRDAVLTLRALADRIRAK